MGDSNWKSFTIIFHCLCWLSTITFVSYWFYKFSLNEDLCIVDYKHFYESKQDVFPVLSLCLRNAFSFENISSSTTNITKIEYLQYLKGEKHKNEMSTVNFEDISMDMSKSVVQYFIAYRNGSEEIYNSHGNKKFYFILTYSGFWSGRFYNCYGIRIPPDKNIKRFDLLVKQDFFPNGRRPIRYDFFTLLHYPNQLLTAISSMKFSWPELETNDTYEMPFYINAVEIIKRRNKKTRSCNERWKNHDGIVLGKHIHEVGCRAPYQKLSRFERICSSADEMKKSVFELESNDFTDFVPCTSMKKIFYTYEERTLNNTKWAGKDHFWIGMHIPSDDFKEIVKTRCVLRYVVFRIILFRI